MSARPFAIVAIIALALVSSLARAVAEPLEPPPESPEDADYEIEAADSLDDGSVELTLGAAGRGGGSRRTSRQVRFNADSLSGSLREGDDDPLAGESLEGHGESGSFGFGRLAPRWGRGLLLGSPAEPWSIAADDRGSRSAFRGRAGSGGWFERDGTIECQALAGKFSGREIGGVSLGARGVRVGALGARGVASQGSLSFDSGEWGSEWAVDDRGRWRAEAAATRTLGSIAIASRARGGHAGFRSIAEPLRSGPAQAISSALSAPCRGTVVRVLGALWRFAPGVPGARAAIEIEKTIERNRILFGFEEQQGVRRAPSSATAKTHVFRQGWWGDWRGGSPNRSLAIHHEFWSARSRMRDPVRWVTSARFETRLPASIRLGVSHSVFRSSTGETVYLAESEDDRLILRALSGAGERTRVDLGIPIARGQVRGSLALSTGGTRVHAPQWSVRWTRRAKFRSKARP